MPKMIDLEDLHRGLAALVDRQKLRTVNPGIDGVVARVQVANVPPMQMWIAQERNAGTPPDEIGNALISFTAQTLAGFVTTHAKDREKQFGMVNAILQGIAEEMASHLTDHSGFSTHHTTKTIEGGRG